MRPSHYTPDWRLGMACAWDLRGGGLNHTRLPAYVTCGNCRRYLLAAARRLGYHFHDYDALRLAAAT